MSRQYSTSGLIKVIDKHGGSALSSAPWETNVKAIGPRALRLLPRLRCCSAACAHLPHRGRCHSSKATATSRDDAAANDAVSAVSHYFDPSTCLWTLGPPAGSLDIALMVGAVERIKASPSFTILPRLGILPNTLSAEFAAEKAQVSTASSPSTAGQEASASSSPRMASD